jgi:hypothetical protein
MQPVHVRQAMKAEFLENLLHPYLRWHTGAFGDGTVGAVSRYIAVCGNDRNGLLRNKIFKYRVDLAAVSDPANKGADRTKLE